MPKRFKNLFEKICTFPNLLDAFYAARKGKRTKPNVGKFETNLEPELFLLQKELLDGTYQPGGYTTFEIHEPKKRMISAAPFRDRVVHHALCNVIEPLLDKTLVHNTYANRTGRGTHAAIRRCQEMMRKYPWVLKCDIKKYFPSIDHAILKAMIARKIGCPPTVDLIFKIIDNSNPQEKVADFFPGDNLFAPASRRRGLPMGNLTSQFFANLFLSPLDHFVAEKTQGCGYIRYVDDFVIFGKSKADLMEIKENVLVFLQKLRLSMHPKKCHISPAERGLTFLGQRIFRTHRILRSENVRRFWHRLRQNVAGVFQRRLSSDDLEIRLNSWRGHAGQADGFRLCRKVARIVRNSGLNLLTARTGGWVILGKTVCHDKKPRKSFRSQPSPPKRTYR